jgi:lipopolysaccharide transport system ATP-binding protein
MEPIVEVKNLSKKYKYGELQKYYTLRDTLVNISKLPLDLFKRKRGGVLAKDEFWALRNISFKIGQGEALGIVGPNGAGKTTLLKVLSRITPPTEGGAILKGRVGSLLEVGTGFHQELTGRENIYLNGAILGMNRREIGERFNEIVNFSGVGKFLDTPVKHYSYGMYMRLAFAIAAHLDPEILIVDEVLAVGDAEFQEKCLQKMDSMSKKEKRTIIFVSHNMEAIRKLCNRAILIDRGRVIKDGNVNDIINMYLKRGQEAMRMPLLRRKDRQGTGQVKVIRVIFKDARGRKANSLRCGEDGEVNIWFKYNDASVEKIDFFIGIASFYDQNNITSIASNILRKEITIRNNPVRIKLRKVPLLPGRYQFNICVFGKEGKIYDYLPSAGIFNVDYTDFYKTGNLPERDQGLLLIKYDIK